MLPSLITYDVFGTIVNWRRGLQADLGAAGCHCTDELFDRITQAQAEAERESFRTYCDITASSLVEVAGLNREAADRIGQVVGKWPLYSDARGGLQRIQRLVPCIAMTNSDRVHGQQVQEQLGFNLSDWVCAEDVRVYKPAPQFWHAVAAKRGIQLSPSWWHVSAYADYDLGTASGLGLTTVFVNREHSLAGPAAMRVVNLTQLADELEARFRAGNKLSS